MIPDADHDRLQMLAGLRAGERRAEVAGTETAILEAGDGAPLLLLHGGIECGGAYWAPVIPSLAERYRIVVPDIPGFGESAPLASLDAAALERWFADLINRTCDRAPLLVAHSLLGGPAAAFAAAHPGLLRGLCVYAAPGIGPYRIPLGLRAVTIRFALRTNRNNAERFERFALLDRERTRLQSPDWFDSFSAYSLARARVPGVKRAMNRLLRMGTRRVPDSELRAIDAPVSLIWGTEDRMVPVELALGARARLGWPLELIDEAAHVPHLERPEAFVASLERLLAEAPGSPESRDVLRRA
jgi:pimeloyl-ACP methyl ester carboxylesterase